MPNKSITIIRHEFMQSLADTTNRTDLPAFVKLEVIERLKSQLENLVQAEYERDLAAYQAELEQERSARTTRQEDHNESE